MWLPPPVPPWVPSKSNDSVDSRASRASLVEGFQLLPLLGEAGRRRDVDLDDTGVGRDAHRRDSRIRRWPVALEDDGAIGLGRRGLQSVNQVDEVLGLIGRRQINVKKAIANLGHDRGGRHGVGVHDIRVVCAGFDGQRPAAG